MRNDPLVLAIFEILYATGIRQWELINLVLQDIDMENCTIRIRNSIDRDRIIPFSEKCRQALTITVRKNNLPNFFCTGENRLLTGDYTICKLRQYAKTADCFTDISIYIFRVTYVAKIQSPYNGT